jgi:hypothetical protein
LFGRVLLGHDLPAAEHDHLRDVRVGLRELHDRDNRWLHFRKLHLRRRPELRQQPALFGGDLRLQRDELRERLLQWQHLRAGHRSSRVRRWRSGVHGL